jgi:hypothetical protein
MGIEYILKKAKELIQSGAIQSNISNSLVQAVEESPEGLEDLLMEIAAQALDEHSAKDARRLYGIELVGYAIAYKVSRKQAEERENPKPKKPSVNEMVRTKLLNAFKL